MRYFHYEPNRDISIECWNKSQFDLCDIVLSLTDNHIFIGTKIYAIFCRPEVLNLMRYFICDFNKIKHDLGIIGEYAERDGNIYSILFNPGRNREILTLSVNEIKNRAKYVYNNIIFDLNEISNIISNN